MCIGLGGENLIRFATVMFEAWAAGRGGAGAVMGSKNLLGIAVGGTSEVKAVHENNLMKNVGMQCILSGRVFSRMA